MSASDSLSEASQPLEQEGEEGWDDWESDEGTGFQSLFGEARFQSLEEALQHDQQQHGFSLRQFRAQHGLDQLGTIRLVNFMRVQAAAGLDPRPALEGTAPGSAAAPWLDDRYLQPAIMDDELLFHDWEGDDEEMAEAAAAQGAGSAAAAAASPPELAALRAENEALRGMLEAMRSVVLADEGMRELAAEAAQQRGGAGQASTAAAAAAGGGGAAVQEDDEAKRIDESYFDSYSTFDIHREMLADKVRTNAYRDALEKNPSLMRGAKVLDVGCGTGILSMCAARGGAAAVVGIDGSEQIAKYARANVEANGLAGQVTIVSSKVEELTALPLPPATDAEGQQQQQAGQVDVLVSEWMGYALLFESMLGSVLHARDRWLRPGGAVLPDVANIYVAAAGAGASGLGFWSDVYGFSMEAVRESLRDEALRRAVVRAVRAQDLISEAQCVQRFDLATMSADDQDFTAPFRLTVGAGPQECHSLVLWFDTLFSQRFCKEQAVVLSTSPAGTQTHWVQTVLLLKEPVLMAPAAVAPTCPDAAVALAGELSMTRSRRTHRSLDIVLRYAPHYADGSTGEERCVIYGMGVEK
ncbi:putative arginine N-methyltransferase 3 [Chlorella sorokiniana]|uniref:type I protein arginine methyltransferase n=1 Tax=Chlorella sorokiniana TaxID=3076 RepID=A0A2P6TBT0_CHLSO|nr:putative arginine N-methyltransferase 3 [Chlorella sorokiniana]|eukprot:PRW18336.1 putative arginine N-methyltransferase 3 [Chlorella sorokiniana]